jgi:hypothetical protein
MSENSSIGFHCTKGVIRSGKSKDRQYNDQKKKDRRNIYNIFHRKLKIKKHEPP